MFSDWDADPRMVMALGGTAGMIDRGGILSGLDASQTSPHRDLGQMMKSLASDRCDLGAKADGSLGHGLTDGQLAPGLTGHLQRDPTFLDPFRYAVVGLTAEPRPMVFRSHIHH